MTQNELIAEIQDVLSKPMTKTDIKEVLVALAEVTAHKVGLDEQVLIPNLVQISGVTRAARTGFNPRTKEKTVIPEQRVVKCRPAGRLKNVFAE